MKIMLSSLFQLPRFTKQLISIAVDSAAIFLALLLAYWIRLGDTSIEVIVIGAQSLAWTVFFTIAFTIVLFAYLGLYKAMLRYMTLH
ncbi:polysaccharide biosynthesis protein, partial [Vibrio breoganii]